MADTTDQLVRLFLAIAGHDHAAARELLESTPALATAGLARADEFFLAKSATQLYAGDSALHAAAFAYDPEMARDLIARGAGVRARNRRGAEPLHAASTGSPDSATWNPTLQREVISVLVAAGADLDATAAGGVTPLHRAVRDRCSAAVDTLLRAGANPRLPNSRGSTPCDLARWTAGRGGAGSAAAKAEQRVIVGLLTIDATDRD